MKKLVMAAVAASALAAAMPAAAQSWAGGDRSDRIEQRIDRGVQDGSLTWREARGLRSQLNSVQRLESRYRFNGLSSWEASDLDRRYDAISAQLRDQRHDTQYRYERGPRNWYGY